MATPTITKSGNVLQVWTPYDPEFVKELKETVPSAFRSWQKPYWMIDPNYEVEVEELVREVFGNVSIASHGATNSVGRFTLNVAYVGRCKLDGYANVMVGDYWKYRVSESVLREWFEGVTQNEPADPDNFYILLGVKPDASTDELKRGYFRAAKVWHPDVNPDPDAAAMFRKVKDAWDLLSNTMQRMKYDAGLRLQQANQDMRVKPNVMVDFGKYGYRAPANCGILDCEIENGVKLTITKIHAWDDDIKVVGGMKLIRVATWEKSSAARMDFMGTNDKGHLVTKWEKY